MSILKPAIVFFMLLAVLSCASTAEHSQSNSSLPPYNSESENHKQSRSVGRDDFRGFGNITKQSIEDAPRSKTNQYAASEKYKMPKPEQMLANNTNRKIALLAPLSGSNAVIGNSMLQAAQLAFFDKDTQGVELLPRDTNSTAEGAISAARDAIASGAQIIIGPLTAAEVRAVKPISKAQGIPVLAMSTDSSLAESGVWVMGFSPEAQTEVVVRKAHNAGARKFGAIIPDTPYGALVQRAFKETVASLGGAIIFSIRPAEINTLQINSMSGIDALFLPLASYEIGKISASLQKLGAASKRPLLMGTGLWDTKSLGRDVPLLQGGWYAGTPDDVRSQFTESWRASYGDDPPRLATLSWDATALALTLTRRGEHFSKDALTNPAGFSGIDGIFRLTQDGRVNRNLTVLEITKDGSRVIYQ